MILIYISGSVSNDVGRVKEAERKSRRRIRCIKKTKTSRSIRFVLGNNEAAVKAAALRFVLISLRADAAAAAAAAEPSRKPNR